MLRLKDYIKKNKEKLIPTDIASNSSIRTNRKTKKQTIKQKWEEKQLYGYFKRQTNVIAHEKIWTCLRKGKLNRETESLLIAAKNNAGPIVI